MSCKKLNLCNIIKVVRVVADKACEETSTPAPSPPATIESLDASKVFWNNQPLDEILEALTYNALVILDFSISPRVFEIGAPVGQMLFSWQLNKEEVISQSLSGPGLSASIAPGTTQHLYTPTDPNLGDSVFTLTINDGKQQRSATQSIVKYRGVYWGVAADQTVNSAFILTMNKELRSDRRKAFTVTAGANQHIWFFSSVALGEPSLFVSGFEGGFVKGIVSFTNSQGYTEDYWYCKSEQKALGLTTVTVE